MLIGQISLNVAPQKEIHQAGIPSSVVEAARAKLLEFLREQYPDLTPDQLNLIAFHSTTWNDSSLGCPEEGQCYAQVLIPGYSLEFQIGDEKFQVHTDANGDVVALLSQ